MTRPSRASLHALLVVALLCLVSSATALQRRAQWRSDSFQDKDTQDTFVSLSELEARIKDIPIDGCNECRYLDDDPLEKVRGEAESDDDRKRFQKDTEAKALKVLRMLEEMNPDGPDAKEAKVEKSIMEQKRLFELASKVRDKALQVLMRNGIEVRLPSEHKTYIDASGRHWGDAEMKDDVSYLKTEFHKWMEEQMKKEQSERNRDNVKQFHNPLAIPAKTVEKLENRGPKQCPCSCPVTQCPCECEAKIKTAEFNQKVEPDTFEELANKPQRPCGPTTRNC